MRSFSGCWTCRLRHKKCDENQPVCDGCAALYITCHYDQEKPEWMDGGVKQEEMAEQVKREVREKAHHRRGERSVQSSGGRAPGAETATGNPRALPQEPPNYLATPVSDLMMATPGSPYMGLTDPIEQYAKASTLWPRGEADRMFDGREGREGVASGWPDALLFTFYLENFLPFLFPFYRPSVLEGGRSWILDMMMSSPVVRQTALGQSSYFFSLALGTNDCDMAWEKVFTQTREAFAMLRQSLQAIDGRGIAGNLHEAVRIVASIMQVQRFDIAVSSFENCQAHLNAALALLKQILDSPSAVEVAGFRSSFETVMSRLGPSSWTLPSQCIQVPSAEQGAFRFSSALVILDDIIASTALQEQPKLYGYHHSLLDATEDAGSSINLEPIVGCQNWALLQIGEIAALDAYKTRCKIAGNLDVMELVHRAMVIRDSLVAQLTRLEADPAIGSKGGSSVLDVFTPYYSQSSKPLAVQGCLVTRVWAHAALIYLFVVVSGWQPASADVRYHVGAVIELLTHQMSPPALLRTMVWPFCVTGCLAEPAQEALLRGMAKELQPPSVFGTVHKALEIMEDVWRNREIGDVATRDLATCLRSQGNLVLLV